MLVLQKVSQQVRALLVPEKYALPRPPATQSTGPALLQMPRKAAVGVGKLPVHPPLLVSANRISPLIVLRLRNAVPKEVSDGLLSSWKSAMEPRATSETKGGGGEIGDQNGGRADRNQMTA